MRQALKGKEVALLSVITVFLWKLSFYVIIIGVIFPVLSEEGSLVLEQLTWQS
jgi:hypothetical protein